MVRGNHNTAKVKNTKSEKVAARPLLILSTLETTQKQIGWNNEERK